MRSKRYYKIKFYLNARHYIWINGHRGETHPHTWEFALTIRIETADFVEFSVFEKGVNAYLDKYQNQLLNDIEPFDTMDPTLENLTDRAADTLASVIREEGGTLLRIEAAETPTRTYIVDLDEEAPARNDEAADRQSLDRVASAVLDDLFEDRNE